MLAAAEASGNAQAPEDMLPVLQEAHLVSQAVWESHLEGAFPAR